MLNDKKIRKIEDLDLYLLDPIVHEGEHDEIFFNDEEPDGTYLELSKFGALTIEEYNTQFSSNINSSPEKALEKNRNSNKSNINVAKYIVNYTIDIIIDYYCDLITIDMNEEEIKAKFEFIFEENFKTKSTKLIFSGLTSSQRRVLHGLCEKKGLFHWTKQNNKDFILSNILRDKIYNLQAQDRFKAKTDELASKLSSISLQLESTSMSRVKRLDLLVQFNSFSLPKPSNGALTCLHELNIEPKEKKGLYTFVTIILLRIQKENFITNRNKKINFKISKVNFYYDSLQTIIQFKTRKKWKLNIFQINDLIKYYQNKIIKIMIGMICVTMTCFLRINKKSINWLCKVVNCPGSETLQIATIEIQHFVQHELVWLHKPFTDKEQASNQFKIDCKIRCESEPNLSARQIFQDEQAILAKNSSASYAELARVLPNLTSLEPTLEKRKKKKRPNLPKSLKDTNLSEPYTLNHKGEKFLILNKSKYKILIFCSPTQLDALSKATHWYVDGTFKSAAKFYYQLYIIHTYINNYMIPCCFVFINRRREKEYDFVLKALKKEAKTNFEQVQNKGCLFHFTQNLLKKLVNCGLKSEYQKNEEFSKWFRSICGLALVPIEKSDQLFEIIMANKPSINGLDKFLDYFVGIYFGGSYTINMWNHFETYDSPRTNNNLDCYNYKLNRHIGISHPDIFKEIDKLKEEEVDLSIKYHKL
ncbi:unnamed protein product [Brachionus calyciflorus]|uniref:MULE transposase domain-containing protein n=1 Tax=Brachionus calyciflorus TaxID=104777 RepID=A0A814CYY5_9BILA|nr:unnamed protein product [Brachionus calyciflorus]